MTNTTIWIVDDEPAICWSLKRALEGRGHHVRVFPDAERAIDELNANGNQCDLLVTDIRLPKMDGFEVMKAFRNRYAELPIIMMTAFGDLTTAVHAMRSHVFEYLVKPFDLNDALTSVEKAFMQQKHRVEEVDFQQSIDESMLLGSSGAIRNVYKQIAMAARSQCPVLILGPEGSPCESVASAIHRHCEKRTSPFLPIVPTAISWTQLEREFIGSFGIEGVSESLSTGVLGLVGEGSIYVDEVTDLPKSLQLQLLRVLDHGSYFPQGATDEHHFRGRLLFSSTRSIDELVEQDEFDKRLKDRISMFTIQLPSLQERIEDAVPIAISLLQRARGNSVKLSLDAIQWIRSQRWSGDVRQLRNVIESAILRLNGSLIEASDLSSALSRIQEKVRKREEYSGQASSPIAIAIQQWMVSHIDASQLEKSNSPQTRDEELGILYEEFLEIVEPPFLKQLFTMLNHNRAAMAAKLGMHRSTLRQKMKRYGID